MQSTIEIEVWKFMPDQQLVEHAPRQYLPFFISDSDGSIGEKESIFYRFPNTESKKDLADQIIEFWNK